MSSGLRIFVIGNRGYASKLLADLLERGEQVVGLSCRKDKTALWGRIKLAAKPIKRIMGRGVDDFLYHGPFDHLPSPETIARRHGITILDARWIKDRAFADALHALAPEVIFMAGFHRLIPKHVIMIPGKVIVNFHPSLLPKHRGGTPNRWVIRNGDNETGVTVHFVTEKFDEGDIILQKRISVANDVVWGTLEQQVADLIVEAGREVLARIREGGLDGIPQQHSQATHEPPLHGKYQIIDWSLPADEVKRICYAVRPKSGGLTSLNGRKLCIWELEPFNETYAQPPGTIVAIEREGAVVVGCGKGVVRIGAFLSHGKIIPAHKIARHLMFKVGDYFI